MGQNQLKDSGKDWPQIVAIIVVCLPSITSALLFSWTSPFLLMLIHDKERYDISEAEADLLPVFMPVGMMVSSIFFFKIPDVIGRKYAILLLNVPQSLFWVITIFAKDIKIFYLARFICGVSDAIMYAALPIYIGEVATPRIRGTWGNGQTFSFNAGFLLINVLGNYFTIPQTACICLSLPIVSAILFLWIPESPYYYLMKGKNEEARKSLQWLLRKDNIELDFLQLKKDVERQISETGSWMDLYKITSNRKALTANLFLRAAQQCAGIIIFETYIQLIFEKSSTGFLSPQSSSIIFSGLLWVVMGAFYLFMDRMGRRKSVIFSCLGCSIVLLAECLYLYIDEFMPGTDLSKLQWFPLAGLLVYVMVYCAGLGPVPGLMAGELFSASIKAKAFSVSNVGLGIFLTVNTYMFDILMTSVGLYAPFVVYTILCFIAFIASFYLIPETRGKTLEEIQQYLKGNEKNKNSK